MPHRLNQLLAEANSPPLDPSLLQKFDAYLALLQKWNARTNLTSIRDEESILSRHFLESILTARALPANIQTLPGQFLLDFGAGAGFPGLPIALLHPQIAVTLAESQNKKAAFLREAVRTLDLQNTQVHGARAETIPARFSAVTLRAVDNMASAIPVAIQLLLPGGSLLLLTTTADSPTLQAHADQSAPILWHPPIPLPAGTSRILLCGNLP